MLAEAGRFPELAAIASGEGTRQMAVNSLANLLPGALSAAERLFAADQFLHMIVTLPQRAAMGLDPR